MRWFLTFLLSRFFAVAALVLVPWSQASAAIDVDVALVLAVDCSGSVDGDEYALQMKGIATAFVDPAIIAAALSGPHHRIAVNLMTWGDPEERKYESGWHIISSADDSIKFAQVARTWEQRQGGGTGIGNGLSYGLMLLRNGDISAPRQVIDISGDGRESWELREPHFKLVDAQKLRAASGVTVNGLAIQSDDPDLAAYYRAFVAAGPESFVIAVANYGEFAQGIRRKLLQELTPNSASLLLQRVRFPDPLPVIRQASPPHKFEFRSDLHF